MSSSTPARSTPASSDCAPRPVGGRARDADDGAGGGEPAARAPRARDARRARARCRRRCRASTSRRFAHAAVVPAEALLAALDEAVRERAPRRGVAGRRSHTASPTSSCGARSPTGSRPQRRRRRTCASRRRSSGRRPAATVARGLRRSRTTMRRRAAVGGLERAVEYNLLAAESAAGALAFEDAAARYRTALELGIDGPARAGRGAPRARRRRTARRRRRGGDRGVPATSPSSRASSATPSSSPGRRSSTRRPAGGRRSTTPARSSSSRRRSPRSARATRSSARGALGGLARALDLRGDPIPAAPRARRVDRDVAPPRRPSGASR